MLQVGQRYTRNGRVFTVEKFLFFNNNQRMDVKFYNEKPIENIGVVYFNTYYMKLPDVELEIKT